VSHHLDSPDSRRDPRLNVTDMYVFDSDSATVLTMIVNTSLAGAGRIADFHPEGRYEFKIHLDGAAAEQLTYRFSFGPADASGSQRVAIDWLAGTDAGDDRAAGTRIAEAGTAEAISGSGVRAWCGAAADPFYLDLHHLAHILEGLQNERPIEAGEWTPAQGGQHLHRLADLRHRPGDPPRRHGAAAWPADRRVGRGQARHRRRRMAAGQPDRHPDGVAAVPGGRRRRRQRRVPT
jgi:Domain of unknown function (DUF4331)